MKKLSLSLILAVSLFGAVREFDGYSYFSFGLEHFEYTEKFDYLFHSTYKSDSGKIYIKGQSVAVKSKSRYTNPVYLSGSLIRFNNKWDLSMDFASTLKPSVAKERWIDRGDNSVITTNYSTIMSNSMKFLLHYKFTNKHRAVFGFSYILNNFKRFNDPDAQTTQLVEETSATATLDFGYWFESNTAANNSIRVKYEIVGGIPVYQHVKNTSAPNLTFTKAKGFNFDTSFSFGYTVMQGLEIDLFANYSYMYRDGETKNYKNSKVIWPTNITKSLKGGIEFTWNFK